MSRLTRLVILLLSVVTLSLAATNIVLRLPEAEHNPVFSLDIDAAQVERVLLYHFDPNANADEPQRYPNPTLELTDPEGIRQLCTVFSQMYAREFPKDALTNAQRGTVLQRSSYKAYVFVLQNGVTYHIYLGRDAFARFDEHWCYATGGKADNYRPLLYLTSRIDASYARNIAT